MYCTPGPDSSNLIKTEKAVPNNPENIANIKYNVPISLALEDKNHLSVQREIFEFKIRKLDLLFSTELSPVVFRLYETKEECEWELVKHYIHYSMQFYS